MAWSDVTSTKEEVLCYTIIESVLDRVQCNQCLWYAAPGNGISPLIAPVWTCCLVRIPRLQSTDDAVHVTSKPLELLTSRCPNSSSGLIIAPTFSFSTLGLSADFQKPTTMNTTQTTAAITLYAMAAPFEGLIEGNLEISSPRPPLIIPAVTKILPSQICM